MTRETGLALARDPSLQWDFLVIGGGASGLGAALEAASRGYRTLLVEKFDFGKGTSSRSSKLIHGGVRYLRQGQIHLVREALRERWLLLRNAPHLVQPLSFVVPLYRNWEIPWVFFGLRLYEGLSGPHRLGRVGLLNRQETIERLPPLRTDGLRGGVLYWDAEFDDARLAISLFRTIEDVGGVALNGVELLAFQKRSGRIAGGILLDRLSGREFPISARIVVNAAGIFSDQIRSLDEPGTAPKLALSRGSHLVLPKSFLPGRDALLIPKTSDGRVLFLIPWMDRVLLGTTEIPVEGPEETPRISPEEAALLRSESSRYLSASFEALASFSGLRPLLTQSGEKSRSHLSREHSIFSSPSGLITLAGGKWTTYRRMGEECIDFAERLHGLPHRPSKSSTLPLHGAQGEESDSSRSVYGSERKAIDRLAAEEPGASEPLHPALPYTFAEILWGIREERALCLEDLLARRTRTLFLDARAAIEAAPRVADLLARELGRSPTWREAELASFQKAAQAYLPP
ncbi:MAG: glycerol-3-phosphate dehydrogenase/oxidase [Candidatus Methylacidiphilaceae bacterium]